MIQTLYPEHWESSSACLALGQNTVNAFAAFYLGWDDCLGVLHDLNESPVGLVGQTPLAHCAPCGVTWVADSREVFTACPNHCGYAQLARVDQGDLHYRILGDIVLPLAEMRETRRVLWDMTGLTTERAFRCGWDACIGTFQALNDPDAEQQRVAAHIARIQHAEQQRMARVVVLDESAEWTEELYAKLFAMIPKWKALGGRFASLPTDERTD